MQYSPSLQRFAVPVSGGILLCILALSLTLYGRQNKRPKSEPVATSQLPKLTVDAARLTVKAWHHVEELETSLAQLPTVFWEPDDTSTLRKWMATDDHVRGQRILEIGPGTGLLSLCALKLGAEHVVAIDINPYAVINSGYNADRMGWGQRMDVRQLDSIERSPMSLITSGERFDVVISNPPWEDAPVDALDQYALYDPGMRLCEFLLHDTREVLTAGGRLLLVYGARKAIELIVQRAPQLGWWVSILDDRSLESLPEVFVPGILLELVRQEER